VRQPTLQSPRDVLAVELKAIHSAERQLSRSLPKLAKKVSSDRLRSMLDQRLERGGELMDQVQQALNEMDGAKATERNVAADGLLQLAGQQMNNVNNESLVDPLLLASVQKIEHYCIAAWGTAAATGRLVGEKQVTRALERAVKDGRRFDEQLNRLAERDLNPRMLEGMGEDEDAEESSSGGRAGNRNGNRRGRSNSSRSKSRSSRSSRSKSGKRRR
jgi:ferritin-like metal-binding protein YciE